MKGFLLALLFLAACGGVDDRDVTPADAGLDAARERDRDLCIGLGLVWECGAARMFPGDDGCWCHQHRDAGSSPKEAR